jgi:hypothetical protein
VAVAFRSDSTDKVIVPILAGAGER